LEERHETASRSGQALGSALAGLFVAACGGGGQQQQQAETGPADLSIICRCVQGGTNSNNVTWLLNSVIPGFTKARKEKGQTVNVKLVQFGGSDEELKARLALDLRSHTGEDVINMDGFWIPEFASANLLKPLDQVGGSDVSGWDGWKAIPGNVQSLLQYNQKQYGVPAGTDARVIWFRKDLFQKAGLPPDWQPKSWGDIYAAADALKKLDGVTPMQVNAGTAMGEATTMQGLYPLITSAGGWIFDAKSNKWIVSSRAFADALGFYKTVYVDKKYGDPRLQIEKDGRNQSFQMFRDGKIGMLWESDYLWRSVLAAGQYKLDGRDQLVGFAKIPAERPGKGYRNQDFVTVSGGTGFALNPNTKHGKEAWALLSYMGSKEQVSAFEQIQPSIPARTDVPAPGDPVVTAMTKLLPLTVVRPNEPVYPKVSEAAQLATQQVVTGDASPDSAQKTYDASVSGLVGDGKTEKK